MTQVAEHIPVIASVAKVGMSARENRSGAWSIR